MLTRRSLRSASAMLVAGAVLTVHVQAQAGAVEDLLSQYKSLGVTAFDADAAKRQWTAETKDPESGEMRSCSKCHTENLRQTGKHATTGKLIDPLSPAAKPERLTDVKQIEKWFRRNCTWVLNRECTPQEKGNFLLFIKSQ